MKLEIPEKCIIRELKWYYLSLIITAVIDCKIESIITRYNEIKHILLHLCLMYIFHSHSREKRNIGKFGTNVFA